MYVKLQNKTDGIQFSWNNRPCSGSELHLAALNGDAAGVAEVLRKSSKVNAVSERLTYETSFQGKSQEGSAEAIHVAASRGHVEVVKTLLSARASLTAMVSRDHKPHFDVLHAATFAEGRGGTAEMIDYLIEARAEMTKNLEGRYPLHIAFQTGNVSAISSLRRYLKDKGITDEDYQKEDPKVPLPLTLGITNGKMTEEGLSEAAELTTLSLRTFIHDCPQCIPSFLKRFQEAEHVSAVELARSMTRMDLARVIRESPEAAVALLSSATDTPARDNKGWHPLPTRVSFAARNWQEQLRNWFNPPRTAFTFYVNEHHWAFDSTSFKAPDWHEVLTDRKFGRPILDAETRVCHVPDLLCAEVFSSLCDSVNDDDDSTTLYKDPIVQAMISHVFWNGCCRTELTWVMLTFWGLTLLILEEIYVRLNLPEVEAEALDDRRLLIGGLRGHKADFSWPDIDFNNVGRRNVWLSICWIASKAMVDLILEFMQFRGFVIIGRGKDYFALDNLRDVVFSILPMFLLLDTSYTPLMVPAVALYWSRTLDCFISAQYIANELLPIKNLTGGLLPALSVTAIAFCAFTHAFYLVNGASQNLYPDVFLESFATLITAVLPTEPNDVTNLKLLLVLIAVLFFSVFILNIFIVVIGEQYIAQRKNVLFSFQKLRAASCFQFLLRCKVLPCRLCSVSNSMVMMLLSACVALGVQAYCFFDHRYHAWVIPTFFVCQLIVVLSSYQDPDTPWVINAHGPEEDHYMWFCRQRDKAEESPAEDCPAEQSEDGLAEEVKDIRDSVESMKEDMKAVFANVAEVKAALEQLRAR